LERSLYNGALDGLSLSGDRFFYGNLLASSGNNSRREWFGTACCPSNIARLVSSLGNYIYSTSSNAIWINLFVGSNTNIALGKNNIGVTMETGYPWKGDVKLKISPAKKQEFELRIRIPGWLNEPAPGNLYHYETLQKSEPRIMVNGETISYSNDNGYAVINRRWKKDDIVTIDFPMEVKRILSNPSVEQDLNRVALQYGPLVYCVEGADNAGATLNIVVPANTVFETKFEPLLLGGVNTIRFQAPVLTVSADGQSVSTIKRNITAIPYFSWNNRGANQMQVWLPSVIKNIDINKK
jgi:uncharacterized protein